MKARFFAATGLALLISTPAAADIFAFKDMDGFEKCLRQDHLVETSKAGDKKQSRFLDKTEVQYRCFESATSHLSKEKKPEVVTEWIKTAMKNSNRANAIDLMKILAGLDLKKCNDSMVYDTILDIFSGPKSDDKKSLYQRAKAVTKICLKDPTFKTDFMDEQDSTPGGYRYDAVCDVLKGEGLIKECKKS
jgi:hypothetical protein